MLQIFCPGMLPVSVCSKMTPGERFKMIDAWSRVRRVGRVACISLQCVVGSLFYFSVGFGDGRS